MLNAILTFISTIVAAFIASVLHDRFKRPTPRYSFEFEKEIPYKSASGIGVYVHVETKYLKNYICLENYGTIALFGVSTEIHFDNKKDRLQYQAVGVTQGVFDLEIEFLRTPLPHHSIIPNPLDGRKKVIEERTKTGFFIDDSDMEKLKSLKSIKVKVKYVWNGKEDSDIWLFDFSNENEVRFHISRPPKWRRLILFFKRRFL